MTYRRVLAQRVQPSSGVYTDWKPQIAIDCHGQCVYCTVTEAEFGGISNFQIDHFRPRSKFDTLTHTMTNLFLSCGICNRFKSNHWTHDPDDAGTAPTIPDPGTHDHGIHFRLDAPTSMIQGTTVAGRFTVERLYLNRPQMIFQRRRRRLELQLEEVRTALMERVAFLEGRMQHDPQARALLVEVTRGLSDAMEAIGALARATPYALADTTRPKAVRSPRKSAGATKPKAVRATRVVSSRPLITPLTPKSIGRRRR